MSIGADKAKLPVAATGSVTDIYPPKGWRPVDLRELWSHRGLLYFFVWRDLKIRYKQTLLGFTWAIIQPLFMMVVFSLFFGSLAKMPSDNIPYPLFSYAALLPWTLFANSLSRGSTSLVSNNSLIQKVYFPRLLLPLGSILSNVVDFLIAFVILIGMMLYFGYYPGVAILMVIPLLVLELMLSVGAGLWLSSMNIKYRDIGYAVPFLVQLLLFASPVVYSTSLVPARFQTVYGIVNPMAGIIDGFRWAILGTTHPSYLIAASAAIVIVILISGVFYFQRCEREFADVV